jgi:hypothetical protein
MCRSYADERVVGVQSITLFLFGNLHLSVPASDLTLAGL